MTGSKSLPLLQGVVLLDGCEESVLKDRAERCLRDQQSVWLRDRQKYKSLLNPVHGNRTQLIMFQ